MQKGTETNNAQRGQTKCGFGFDGHRFHMFTDDMRSGERVGSSSTPLAWSLFSSLCNPRLRQKEISVGYLTQMKERLNVNFLTTICRQTVFVKKSF